MCRVKVAAKTALSRDNSMHTERKFQNFFPRLSADSPFDLAIKIHWRRDASGKLFVKHERERIMKVPRRGGSRERSADGRVGKSQVRIRPKCTRGSRKLHSRVVAGFNVSSRRLFYFLYSFFFFFSFFLFTLVRFFVRIATQSRGQALWRSWQILEPLVDWLHASRRAESPPGRERVG